MIPYQPYNNIIDFPARVANPAMGVYMLMLAVVSFAFMSYALPWYYFLVGVIEVLAFFYFVRRQNRRWAYERPKRFERKVFWTGFFIRAVCVSITYVIYVNYFNDPLGWDSADASYYNDVGQFVAGLIQEGNFHFYQEIYDYSGGADWSDMGYSIYLGFVYFLTGNSIFVARLVKCAWSAGTVVLMYRLASRQFGEGVGRLTALFCILMPNFWYYCTCQLKEVEMVFLAVLYVDQTDLMLRSGKITVGKLIPILLIILALFSIRVPLAIVAVLALLFTVVMSSNRVISWGKRLTVGALAIGLIAVTMGNRIVEESKSLYEASHTSQSLRLKERARGQSLVKNLSTAVFAPMMFTIPFPTMVDIEGQYTQKLLNGGNYIKNILSGFVVLVMFVLLLSGKWRDHMMPLAFMLGYLVVVAASAFAHSERFHQPALPFELMFAAYGISLFCSKTKYQRLYSLWLMAMLCAGIMWNWFKLAGRGLA